MELGEVSRIRRLVPEHPIDREHLCRLEPSRLVGEVVQHLRRDGGRVRAEEESLGFREGY